MKATSAYRPRIRIHWIDRLPKLSRGRLVAFGLLMLIAATLPSGLLLFRSSAPILSTNVAAMPPQSAFYAYPDTHQTVRQQSKDRSECENWATGQTGVNPAQPIGPTAPSGAASRLIDYRRALSACLEGRGYRVSFPDTSRLWG